MYIKISSLIIAIIITAQAQEKTEIFNDKYLNQQKLDPYRNTDVTSNIDYKITDVKKMTNTSEEINKDVLNMIEKNNKSKSLENKAQEINNYTKTKDFKKKVDESENYLLYDKKINWQQHLGQHNQNSNPASNNVIKNLKQNSKSDITTSNQFLNSNERIFIIISSSIPKHILKNYFDSLQSVNTDVTFVLRGTIGGVKKIMPTLNWIQDVLKKDENSRYEYNIIIEPRIVSKYNIEKVPAVLYVNNYNPSYLETSKDEKHYIYYGTVDIDYALEKINLDAKSEGLKKVLNGI